MSVNPLRFMIFGRPFPQKRLDASTLLPYYTTTRTEARFFLLGRWRHEYAIAQCSRSNGPIEPDTAAGDNSAATERRGRPAWPLPGRFRVGLQNVGWRDAKLLGALVAVVALGGRSARRGVGSDHLGDVLAALVAPAHLDALPLLTLGATNPAGRTSPLLFDDLRGAHPPLVAAPIADAP